MSKPATAPGSKGPSTAPSSKSMKTKKASSGAEVDKVKAVSKKVTSILGKTTSSAPLISGLPSCRGFRARGSGDRLVVPDDIRAPYLYSPPFRRNLRYFGYPQDLNPELDTPPRARSWGPIPEVTPKTRPVRSRTPSCFKMETGLDPYWPGRLLKNSTMLENPTLVPVMGKAVQNLGPKPVPLLKPDLELTNCVSELYFPLAETSRRVFCRMNKMVQENMTKQAHNFMVQNPTRMKKTVTEMEVQKSEEHRRSVAKPSLTKSAMAEHNRKRRASRFSIINLEKRNEEAMFFERAPVPEIVKLLCIPSKYPGKNKQVYGRPTEDEHVAEVKTRASSEDILLRPGIDRSVYKQFHVPEDLWEKLAKVRVRKQHMDRVRQNRMGKKKDKEFNQLQLRNEVLEEAKINFLANLTRNVNTPLPKELFEDNRQSPQPEHDYMEYDERPAQGPFFWKTVPEKPPTEEELALIEAYIETLKESHNFNHHLPGLLYVSAHPFPHLELDWFEEGAEMDEVKEKRPTPVVMHDLPYYLAELDEEHFEETFQRVLNEKAKDLVGPEVWELYREHKGLRSTGESKTDLGAEAEAEAETEQKKVRRVIRVKRPKKVEEEEEEAEEEAEAEEDHAHEEEEHPQGEDENDPLTALSSSKEVTLEEKPSEYDLEQDLNQEVKLPLPDVHFNQLDFPKEAIPQELLSKDERKIMVEALERLENLEPVKKDEVEPMGSDQESDSTTDSEVYKESVPEMSHDAKEHLQDLYMEAIKAKMKSHRHLAPDMMAPPKLKDVFLEKAFIEDIEYLLQTNPNLPSFLQLFEL